MRTRWQRLEERRNTYRAVRLILSTVVIVGAAIFFGFNLLTKIFLFIGNLNEARRPIEKTDFIPPSPPQFRATVEATNSAILTVKGTAEAGATVYLTLNSDSIGNTVTSDDGVFEFTRSQLVEGKNTFSAVALDEAGNRSQPSSPLVIYYSTKAPELKIESPADGQVISGNEARVEITGTTDPEVRLTVNERVVIVNSSGKFAYRLGLAPGDNSVIILATDRTGNQTRKEMVITYRPQ